MRITGTSPLTTVEPSTATSRTTATSAPESAEAKAANALTDSDKSFLLNGFGVAVTTNGQGALFFTPNHPMSDDEMGAVMGLTTEIATDRTSGQLQGNVTPSYLASILSRAKDDSTKAYQAALQHGIDYLIKGSPVKHVDTQA
jgi:hypothetical protein